jgi:predicted small lipoprotein YifL
VRTRCTFLDNRRVFRAIGITAFAATALFMLTACGRSALYVPPTITGNPPVARTLAQLESRINAKDAAGVCAHYAFPSRRCTRIWRARLRTWRVPVQFALIKVTPGCAGDARVTLRETNSQGRRIRTLSLVTHDNPEEYTHVIDFPLGSRPSSLVIPRYGTCADMEGSAGTDNLDPAAGSGA